VGLLDELLDGGDPALYDVATTRKARTGRAVALGYHTGHWEVAQLVEAAARELRWVGVTPFAGACSDPCDGRSQGTVAMFDSLPYRTTRRPCVLVPGGVCLMPDEGEDAGRVQAVGARFAHDLITLEQASLELCRACASPGGGCQLLGTAATSQVVAEASGLALTHSALAPSGQPIWRDMARRSAQALVEQRRRHQTVAQVITPAAIRNAMTVHAAFGGSTNLILHIPALAHGAGVPRPTVDEWVAINRQVPRLVDAMPNGPIGHSTARVFMAGGVPEVMLHLRDARLLDLDALTASGDGPGHALAAWERSERRRALRARCGSATASIPTRSSCRPAPPPLGV
jgi:xylonate dehydratase